MKGKSDGLNWQADGKENCVRTGEEDEVFQTEQENMTSALQDKEERNLRFTSTVMFCSLFESISGHFITVHLCNRNLSWSGSWWS